MSNSGSTDDSICGRLYRPRWKAERRCTYKSKYPDGGCAVHSMDPEAVAARLAKTESSVAGYAATRARWQERVTAIEADVYEQRWLESITDRRHLPLSPYVLLDLSVREFIQLGILADELMR